MANAESTVQIVPFYAHPHVHTVINDNTFYDETVATVQDPNDLPYATIAVTGADSGIDNTFVRINDLKVKETLFGKSNFKKYGQASIQADEYFNGQTNVWFCRVLPDNATYANTIILAHYRKGKILDELGQETGKFRMEVKFSTVNAMKPALTNGALKDFDIEEYARTVANSEADAQSGYLSVPICYIRATGHGKYGNQFSVSISRDLDAEKEYSMKMYTFNVLKTEVTTKVINIFSGSLFPTTRYQMSTLINDVIDQYATGSCPVAIQPFEESFTTLYDFYRNEVVAANYNYMMTAGATPEEIKELQYAEAITNDCFDPIFGIKMNNRTGESIPYYKNYTKPDGYEYIAPDLVVPTEDGATKPLNVADWTAAAVGARVLVTADPLNDARRWEYTIVSIDNESGNIVYDEGVESAIDADQYDGINLSVDVGIRLNGGHDGDFQEITVNGETRAPTDAEMKLLLSREYVKAFRGKKDRKILSPSRVNLDFIFDANYNMTDDESLNIESVTQPMFNGSTVITDKDAQTLAITGSSSVVLDFTDLNVKKAMYDLNEFRCRNGMTVNAAQGAGTSLYLDCNLTGLSSLGINYELMNIIKMMEGFDGRQTSIDLGYYEIFDKNSNRRIQVTATYFLAQNLIPHLMKYGLNKPFVYKYAQLRALQRDSSLMVSGNMIRDTFRPDIDLIDWDVKESLYNSRINYYLTLEEGRIVQRAVQNTRQREASALLEENNVRVLNALKKGLEAANRGYLYEWNDPVARKGYTDTQMQIYKPWIGTLVEDLDIKFTANEWEQERMIMHCYVVVKFRDIVKRIILEINIQRPSYTENPADEEGSEG